MNEFTTFFIEIEFKVKVYFPIDNINAKGSENIISGMYIIYNVSDLNNKR